MRRRRTPRPKRNKATETIIQPIAQFHSPLRSKFGIPRQSGLVEELEGEIVFEPPFRNPDFIRGLEEFDYIWLIWEFSANRHQTHNAMVRPPLLGGSQRVGVFATRSPFRPNSLGLSSVRIAKIEWEDSRGPVVKVKGADLMDGTPIFDIKPYVAYADSHEGARSGFVDQHEWKRLKVVIPDEYHALFTPKELESVEEILSWDPRPQTQIHHDKTFGMPFGKYDIRFRVKDDILTVVEIVVSNG